MGASKSKVSSIFFRVIDGATAVLMIALTLVVFLEVISRYLFNFSLTFVSSFTQLLFPWMVFLAAIAVTRREEHIAVDFLVMKLKKKKQKWLVLFSKLIILAFSIFMTIAGLDLTLGVMNQPIPILNISRSWLYGSIALSFLIISLITLYQFIAILLNKEVWKGGTTIDLDNDY